MDGLGWVGLGGGTKVLLACSNANKTRKTPEPRKKKTDRQTTKQRCNNCCDTHEDPRKKKKGNRDRVRCFSSSRGEVAVAVGAAPHNHHIW